MTWSLSESAQPSADSASGPMQIDRCWALLQYLANEARWPDTTQGEFLAYLAGDVLEIASSIRNLAASDCWTTVALLGRPLFERSQFLLAAAIDPAFWDVYRQRMEVQIDSNFKKRPGLLAGEARRVIDNWEQKRTDNSDLADSTRYAWSTSSELLHHSIGMSRMASQDSGRRTLYVKGATAQLRSACGALLTSLGIVGGHNTALAASGWAFLSALFPPDDQSEGETSS